MSLKTAIKGTIGGQVANAGKIVTGIAAAAWATTTCNAKTGGAQMTLNRELVPLRRTIRPYVGQTIIYAGLTVLCVFVFLKTSESAFLWLPAVPWSLFGISIVFFGMRYRVLWDNESVVMRASGGPERRIQFDEITNVKKEVSSAGDILAQSRPFSRIAVYRNRGPNGFVDISLRHFRLEDVEELLAAIRKSRPDLCVPST